MVIYFKYNGTGTLFAVIQVEERWTLSMLQEGLYRVVTGIRSDFHVEEVRLFGAFEHNRLRLLSAVPAPFSAAVGRSLPLSSS